MRWKDHLLADKVVTNSKQTDGTSPGAGDLPSELVSVVLSVSTNTEQATKSGDSDNIANDNGVALVLVGPVLGLLRLLLGLLALSLGLLLQLLGLLLSLVAKVPRALLGLGGSIVAGLLELLGLLARVLGGLLLSLLGFALLVGERGRGLEVCAVERVKGVHAAVIVGDLGDVVGHPGKQC